MRTINLSGHEWKFLWALMVALYPVSFEPLKKREGRFIQDVCLTRFSTLPLCILKIVFCSKFISAAWIDEYRLNSTVFGPQSSLYSQQSARLQSTICKNAVHNLHNTVYNLHYTVHNLQWNRRLKRITSIKKKLPETRNVVSIIQTNHWSMKIPLKICYSTSRKCLQSDQFSKTPKSTYKSISLKYTLERVWWSSKKQLA